jgi:1-acyl-sn-glycerol-3-phosphate acyltransferase
VVIVANHQFSLDLFAIFYLWTIFRKMTVVSKASLKYLGPFGFVAQKCGVVFIDRKQGKQSHEIIQVGFYVKATQTCWGK